MPSSIVSRVLSTALLLGLATPTRGLAQTAAEAFVGQPFGVGRVEIDVPPATEADAAGSAGLLVTDREGRVFYPTSTGSQPQAGRAVRNLVERIQRPRLRALGELATGVPAGRPAVYFLFVGQEPLQVVLQSARQSTPVTLRPSVDAAAHGRLAERWWRAYAEARRGLGLLTRQPDYPPMAETYLQSMLARRFGLTLPERRGVKSWEEVFGHELGLSVASEPIRVSMLQERMLGRSDLGQAATLAMPAPIPSSPTPSVAPPADVKVEPMALRVPEECLYLHFGNYPNYLWYSDMTERWGGDLRNLLAERGVRYDLNERSQRQLILRPTDLSRLFGPTVIADVAIIATDLYQPDGAALGMLFQARNGLLLGSSLSSERAAALRANKDAKEEKVEIAGRRVSFIHTPNNTIRSFYAVDGDFHLVTTSRTVMRRFLETGSGQGSLGRSKEFRRGARAQRPADGKDTIFAYLSSAFFRNMVRPEYRVEISRRLQAAADIDALQLARLAATAERQSSDTVEQLRAGGFLPPEFGPRPDGSQAVIGKSEVYDSLRGARGTFIPVPDVEVTRVTPAEADAYERFRQYYAAQFGPVEPIVVAMRRTAIDGKRRERVVIDATMGPLNRQRYESIAEKLGEADTMRVASIAGDVLFVEAILRRQRLFVGLRDFGTPPETPEGGLGGLLNLLPTGRLRDLFYGYLGTVGETGPLGVLDRSIVTPPDASGFARSLGLLWRRDLPPFHVFSLHREILEQVTPQLRLEQAERPAQVRARVADLSQAGVAPMAQKMAYRRALAGTQGNLRLIHSMISQFHMPPAVAVVAAETLMGVDLICPLGGRYVYRKLADGSGCWTSTALDAPAPNGSTAVNFPPLNWFRGLNADARLTETQATIHAEVDMDLSAGAVKSKP